MIIFKLNLFMHKKRIKTNIFGVSLKRQALYPPKIQKRLGHASLKITMDTYAHFFDKHDKKMVDALDDIQGAQKGHFF